jgi:penicillin-binding protein 1A
MIEHTYSKRRILEMYLNEIYFGRGAYGIEAASREYFGKHAAQLTLDEAALLAALPRAPSVLNPRSNLEQAQKGRRTVLRRMVAQHGITHAEAAAAAAAPVRLRRRTSVPDGKAPYFVQAVRQLLEDSLSESVDRFRYTVETTLDSKLQQIAEEELARQLAAIESGALGSFVHPTYAGATHDSLVSVNGTDYLQAALLFMDPRTGDVRALIGGRDYHDSQFNRAFNANRQMASTFKPMVFAAAIAAGYPPSLRLSDQPLRMAVGFDRVIRQARLAGMRGPFPSGPSVMLGAVEATPIELTTAYATLATLGRQPQPRLVTRVLDADGKVLWSQPPVATAALDPSVAFVVNEMLKDAIDSGTAIPLRATGYRGIVAGKTGTSNGSADLWFVGYTPQIVGTIWIGFDQPKTIVPGGESGAIAAPIWGRIMRRFGDPAPDWKSPRSVIARRVDR